MRFDKTRQGKDFQTKKEQLMKTIQQISVDANMIYQRLSKMSPDEVIEYRELSELIDKDIQKGARGYLYTALKKVLRDDGFVFGTIMGKGIKRLTDEENAQTSGVSAIRKIRGYARRGMKRLAAVKDFDSMPASARAKHNMGVCVLGALKQGVGNKRIDAIESAIANNGALPINKTLDLFK